MLNSTLHASAPRAREHDYQPAVAIEAPAEVPQPRGFALDWVFVFVSDCFDLAHSRAPRVPEEREPHQGNVL
jgi:hypothetical protein